MNKGLEALKLLKDFSLELCKNGLDRRLIVGSSDAIEKELEEKEELEKDNELLIRDLTTVKRKYNELLRYKKALEIIKNKGVFVHLLQQSKSVEEYNSLMLIAFKKSAERNYKGAVEKFCLTQEEYDLLKEILL